MLIPGCCYVSGNVIMLIPRQDIFANKYPVSPALRSSLLPQSHLAAFYRPLRCFRITSPAAARPVSMKPSR